MTTWSIDLVQEYNPGLDRISERLVQLGKMELRRGFRSAILDWNSVSPSTCRGSVSTAKERYLFAIKRLFSAESGLSFSGLVTILQELQIRLTTFTRN